MVAYCELLPIAEPAQSLCPEHVGLLASDAIISCLHASLLFESDLTRPGRLQNTFDRQRSLL